MEGKYIRVDGSEDKILGIGNVSEDKWFFPDKEFKELREMEAKP